MKILFMCLFSTLVCVSQQNMDTIYGNPKSVREKVIFLNKSKLNYKFLTDSDYGHGVGFFPKAIKERFNSYWYNYHWVFYVNYYKEFLKNGEVKTEIWYNRDSTLKSKYEYTHNKNRNLTEEKKIYFDSTFSLRKNTYDYKGKLKSYIFYYSDKTDMYQYVLFKHDAANNLVKTTRFNDEGYTSTIYNTYSSQNKLLNTTIHSPKKWVDLGSGSSSYVNDSVGTWTTRNKYEYDLSGNLVLKLRFADKNSISRKTIYKYDSNNNLIYEGYARDTVYAYKKYDYNKNNDKVYYEYAIIGDSTSRHLVKFTYNKKGYITKAFCFLKSKAYNIDFNYKFDDNNNWIEIVKTVNGEPLFVWTRKIVYHN